MAAQRTTLFWLIQLIAISVLLTGFSSALEARVKKAKFDERQIVVDFKVTQPLFTVDLENDQQMEIAAIGEDLDHKRLLAIYHFEPSTGNYILGQKMALADSLILADKQSLKGEADQLLFLDNQGIYRYDLATNQLMPLLKTKSIYIQDETQYLARANFAKDINNDGNDDLVIADFRELNLYLWQAKGPYQHSVLDVQPWLDLQNQGASLTVLDMFGADIDQDGNQDLVQAEGKSLQVFTGSKAQGYSKTGKARMLKNPIYPVQWWRLKDASGDTADQSHVDHRQLENIKDLNNDGVPDLMVRRDLSSGVLDRKMQYEFYFGRGSEQGVTFPPKADSFIEIDGTLAGLELVDLNGDGKTELIMGSFEIGVSQVIGALLSGSIDQDVRVFAINNAFNYDREPALEKEVALNFSLSSGRSGQPVVLTADLDGDGHKELLLNSSETRLNIYRGLNNKKLLSHRSLRYKTELPKDGNMLKAADLDGDGKDELIIRYGKQDDAKLGKTIRILKLRPVVK